ncbi:unnamed protein product [Calypogeia fissa]
MRPTCSKCDRPSRVCLCAQLPPKPIQTATKVVILQHPHETRQKLATVPVVSRCLANVDVIVGRRLQHGTSRLLDSLSSSSFPSTSSSSSPSPSPCRPLKPVEENAAPPSPSPSRILKPIEESTTPPRPPPSSPPLKPTDKDAEALVDEAGWRCRSCGRKKTVLFLFPTPSATELSSWVAQCVENDVVENGKPHGGSRRNGGENFVEQCGCEEEEVVGRDSGSQLGLGFKGRSVCGIDGESGHLILLIVDGTWQHAREMVKASMPFLSEFVEQVCFPHDITREGWGLGDSSSIIRKEPFAGCVSTLEAIARALGMLEPDGVLIEQTLLSVLRQMVYLQALHFAPLKPRPRLRKERPVCNTSQTA